MSPELFADKLRQVACVFLPEFDDGGSDPGAIFLALQPGLELPLPELPEPLRGHQFVDGPDEGLFDFRDQKIHHRLLMPEQKILDSLPDPVDDRRILQKGHDLVRNGS